ncbi:MAG TPA: MASE1 domain-containing protein [Caulobacteraceae bacterium]
MKSIGSFLPGLKDAPLLAILTGAYWLTAVAGLQFAVVPGAGTAVWPAAGIAFAALLIFGPQLWPAIFIGRLLTAVTVASPQPMWADVLLAFGTALAAVVPIVPMRRLEDLDHRLGNLRDILWLILGGAVLGGLISAGVGALALWLAGTHIESLGLAIAAWALGYSGGVLLVAPLLLSWGPRSGPLPTPSQTIHLAACLLAVTLVAGAIFTGPPANLMTYHLVPVLVWAAIAFNVRGAALAMLITAVLALWGTLHGWGPFARMGDETMRLIFVQQFVAVTAGTIFALAAVSDERRNQERLRRSERQFRAVFDLAGVGLAETARDGSFLRANPRYCEITGYGEEELLAKRHYDIVFEDDIEAARASFNHMLRGGSTHLIQKRLVKKDGGLVWVRSNAAAIRDEHGRAVGAIWAIDDISDERQVEQALRDETSALETINETGAGIAAELDLDRVVQRVTDAGVRLTGAQFGAFFYNVINDAGESFLLFALSGAPREAFESFGHPRNTPVFAPTFKGEGIVRVDDITRDPRYGTVAPHHGMPKGHLPVRSYLAVPVRSRGGEVIGGLFFGHEAPGVFTERAERLMVGIAAQAAIAIDNARLFQAAQRELAERRRAEEHQRLLINELNHRVKNTLASVQSIAAQTLRSFDNVKDAESAFTARLMALSTAHNVLTQQSWEGAELQDIVNGAVQPFDVPAGSRFTIEGPRVWLEPKAALSLAMALHELGTNAAKYGALSGESGRVHIAWTLKGRRLALHWREEGGPPVKAPGRSGFGSRLIEKGLAADLRGRASIRYEPAGVECDIEATLEDAPDAEAAE